MVPVENAGGLARGMAAEAGPGVPAVGSAKGAPHTVMVVDHFAILA